MLSLPLIISLPSAYFLLSKALSFFFLSALHSLTSQFYPFLLFNFSPPCCLHVFQLCSFLPPSLIAPSPSLSCFPRFPSISIQPLLPFFEPYGFKAERFFEPFSLNCLYCPLCDFSFSSSSSTSLFIFILSLHILFRKSINTIHLFFSFLLVLRYNFFLCGVNKVNLISLISLSQSSTLHPAP